MKIEYKRFDFAEGTIEVRERDIDSKKVLAGNALFRRLSGKPAEKDATYQRLNFGPELT